MLKLITPDTKRLDMTKKNKTIFNIFTEAVGLYFSNFKQFFKYMSFPVLGQILGLGIILFTTFIYTQNLPKLIERYPNINNMNSLILLSVLVTLPGLLIFTKAFWEYLIAYGAINSMTENMLKSGRVYDFKAHTELISRRSPAFIGVWLIAGILSIIAVCPFFSIICAVLGVYFVLIFQVFTFEEDKNPIGCFKRSLELIKGQFARTFFLIIFAGGLTYFIIPQIAQKLLELINGIDFLSKLILPVLSNLPVIDLSQYGGIVITQNDISKLAVTSLIAQILICYTLPIRSIMWTLWYKKLSNNKITPVIEKKSSKKRPSEKLMDKSHKKYGKKKIDKNILKRAMEKEDE